MQRRQFIASTGSALAARALLAARAARGDESPARKLFYVSAGSTWILDAAGGQPDRLSFDVPNQATWQPGPAFRDGRRVVLLSMEPRRDGPGRPFEEYYTQTPTHLWIYDLVESSLVEIAQRERMAVFYTPALLLGDDRLLVQVVKDRVGQIFSMQLDGSDAREFTRAGEGLPYGLSLSPDGRRVAFHLASPEGYQIWTSDLDGADRRRVAAHPAHLYFGTSWSPDGQWILYQDCHYQSDPGHDWSDLCIGRADGSEHRVLTEGRPQWFAATYGNPQHRGSGSNMPCWTPDGAILFSRKLPETRVPWQYRIGQTDVDHFNRDFQPELAHGGTEICRLDPHSGRVEPLTAGRQQQWDFRIALSPDGRQIAFCRAPTGGSPSLWIMNADGSEQRMLIGNDAGGGIDHPRWIGG